MGRDSKTGTARSSIGSFSHDVADKTRDYFFFSWPPYLRRADRFAERELFGPSLTVSCKSSYTETIKLPIEKLTGRVSISSESDQRPDSFRSVAAVGLIRKGNFIVSGWNNLTTPSAKINIWANDLRNSEDFQQNVRTSSASGDEKWPKPFQKYLKMASNQTESFMTTSNRIQRGYVWKDSIFVCYTSFVTQQISHDLKFRDVKKKTTDKR